MFYHHHTVRKYTISLLDVFNDIEVPRYNDEGLLIKTINVPIVFASTRDRAVQLIEQDYTATEGQQVLLPRMALSLTSLEKATSRDTNRYNKVNLNKVEDGSVSYQYNSVAYDFSFTLSIMTRTMTDLMVIVEQILPMFRPTMNMRFRELEFANEDTSVPVNLGAVSFDFPESMDEDDNIKILSATIDLSIRGALHLPIKGGSYTRFGIWSFAEDFFMEFPGFLPIFNIRTDGTFLTDSTTTFLFKAGVLYNLKVSLDAYMDMSKCFDENGKLSFTKFYDENSNVNLSKVLDCLSKFMDISEFYDPLTGKIYLDKLLAFLSTIADMSTWTQPSSLIYTPGPKDVCELRSTDGTTIKEIPYKCTFDGNCHALLETSVKFDTDTEAGIFCSGGVTIIAGSYIRITENIGGSLITQVLVNMGTEPDKMNAGTVRAIFDDSKPFGDVESSITTHLPPNEG